MKPYRRTNRRGGWSQSEVNSCDATHRSLRLIESQLLSAAPSTARRRGAVMVAAMICLLLATVLLGSVLKMAMTGRKQVRREQWRVQAAWLAEAGLERAASRLSADADYQGETWNIAAADLDGRHTGQVVIQIEAAEGSPATRLVTVEAFYPSGSVTFAKKTRTATVGPTLETRKDEG